MMAVRPEFHPVTLPRATTAGLLLAALVGLAGCGKGGHDGAIQATGHVEAIEVRVSARVGGRLLHFDPIEGSRLAAGDVLAVIDSVDLVADRNRRVADLATARANLDLLAAG
ncbi:MAG TPA: hypothetical protein VF720_07855, partial [Candidatus Eisenbacteria bacterium]